MAWFGCMMLPSMWGMYRTRRRSREGVVSGCAATVEDSGCQRGPVGVGAGLSHLSRNGAFWRDPGPRLIGFPSLAAVEVVWRSICSGRGTLQLQIQEIFCRAITTPAAAGRAEGCRGRRTCGPRTRWRAPMSMAWSRCKVLPSMWGMYRTRRRSREGVVSGCGVGAPLALRQRLPSVRRVWEMRVDEAPRRGAVQRAGVDCEEALSVRECPRGAVYVAFKQSRAGSQCCAAEQSGCEIEDDGLVKAEAVLLQSTERRGRGVVLRHDEPGVELFDVVC